MFIVYRANDLYLLGDLHILCAGTGTSSASSAVVAGFAGVCCSAYVAHKKPYYRKY